MPTKKLWNVSYVPGGGDGPKGEEAQKEANEHHSKEEEAQQEKLSPSFRFFIEVPTLESLQTVTAQLQLRREGLRNGLLLIWIRESHLKLQLFFSIMENCNWTLIDTMTIYESQVQQVAVSTSSLMPTHGNMEKMYLFRRTGEPAVKALEYQRSTDVFGVPFLRGHLQLIRLRATQALFRLAPQAQIRAAFFDKVTFNAEEARLYRSGFPIVVLDMAPFYENNRMVKASAMTDTEVMQLEDADKSDLIINLGENEAFEHIDPTGHLNDEVGSGENTDPNPNEKSDVQEAILKQLKEVDLSLLGYLGFTENHFRQLKKILLDNWKAFGTERSVAQMSELTPVECELLDGHTHHFSLLDDLASARSSRFL